MFQRRKAAQVAHIQEHVDKLKAHASTDSAQSYFDDYWEAERPNDLYLGVCADLNLEPRAECLVPEDDPAVQ